MEKHTQRIYSRMDRNLSIAITPGHFVTTHSHINYYIDMTEIRTNHEKSKVAADALSKLLTLKPVDTILCIEGTQSIGAFLAEDLASSVVGVNSQKSIHVITPEINSSAQFVFRDNTKVMIEGKQILLLLSSASTGKTIRRSIECLEYYGGMLSGVAALFSAAHNIAGMDVTSLFTEDDLPHYESYTSGSCEMCKNKQKINAIVNPYGYAKL